MTRRVFLLAGAGFSAPKRGPIALGSLDRVTILRRVEPEYPPEALKRRIHGKVRLTILVGEDGMVRQARVISGHPLLVAAAVKALRFWLFQPIHLNGSPVEFYAPLEIRFTLPRSAPLKKAGTPAPRDRNTC